MSAYDPKRTLADRLRTHSFNVCAVSASLPACAKKHVITFAASVMLPRFGSRLAHITFRLLSAMAGFAPCGHPLAPFRSGSVRIGPPYCLHGRYVSAEIRIDD